MLGKTCIQPMALKNRFGNTSTLLAIDIYIIYIYRLQCCIGPMRPIFSLPNGVHQYWINHVWGKWATIKASNFLENLEVALHIQFQAPTRTTSNPCLIIH